MIQKDWETKSEFLIQYLFRLFDHQHPELLVIIALLTKTNSSSNSASAESEKHVTMWEQINGRLETSTQDVLKLNSHYIQNHFKSI